MNEWKEYKLKDVANVKYGKAHQSLSDGYIPAYGSGGLIRYVEKALYNEESILIPRKGTLNNIIYKDEPFWTVDTMFWTELNKKIIVPKYLFYQLSLIDFSNMNVGSAVPSMTIPILNDIDIYVPSIPEQTAIASILSSLDDKIDLLHRQNATLEKMAETLFRHWFVEEAKEEWGTGKLGDEFVLTMGASPPGESYNEEGFGIPMYQGNADFGFRFPTNRVFTTDPKRFAEKYDTLVSVRAPVGEQNMANERCCIGRGVAAFRFKKDNSFYTYTYYKMKSLINDIKQFNETGTVFGSISKSDFENIEIVIPDKISIHKFQNEANPIDDKITTNTIQVRTLTALRDTLLPKLMSGKVRVEM